MDPDELRLSDLQKEIKRLTREHARISALLNDPVQIENRRARRGVGLGRWAETQVLPVEQLTAARNLADEGDHWLYDVDDVLLADGWTFDQAVNAWRGPRNPRNRRA